MLKACAPALRAASRLRHLLAGALCGRGRPIPADIWNAEYRAGAWDYLDSLPEMARYMMIFGYSMHVSHQPHILDLGCGHGRLRQIIPDGSFASYVGVDCSAEALKRAEHLASTNTRFVLADFETWRPERAMDVIVFNESLYHSTNPAEVIQHYRSYLTATGRFIISIFEGDDRLLWRPIEQTLRRVDAISLLHESGRKWRVGLFEPKD